MSKTPSPGPSPREVTLSPAAHAKQAAVTSPTPINKGQNSIRNSLVALGLIVTGGVYVGGKIGEYTKSSTTTESYSSSPSVTEAIESIEDDGVDLEDAGPKVRPKRSSGSEKSKYIGPTASDRDLLKGTSKAKKAEDEAVKALRLTKFTTLESLKDEIRKGSMTLVRDNSHYSLSGIGEKDPENRSLYASLRPHAKKVLDKLAKEFYEKFNEKCVVTSLTRTEKYVDMLRKTNKNASKTSTHMSGTTFDIAKNSMTEAQLAWMRKTLAAMERSGEIIATEEWTQPCFHIVATRMDE